MKLSQTHAEIIRSGATGVCVKGAWLWLRDGRPVTREVNTLLRHKLVDASYYRNGSASTWATDAGEKLARAA